MPETVFFSAVVDADRPPRFRKRSKAVPSAGRWVRSAEMPISLGNRVFVVHVPRHRPSVGEVDMSRSRLFGRVLGSAASLVTLVAVVGAGWKW